MLVELSLNKRLLNSSIDSRQAQIEPKLLSNRDKVESSKSLLIKYDPSKLTKEIAHNLNRKSLKNFRIIMNKNKQEETRFRFLNRLIDKEFNREDYQWFIEFRREKTILDEINSRTEHFKQASPETLNAASQSTEYVTKSLFHQAQNSSANETKKTISDEQNQPNGLRLAREASDFIQSNNTANNQEIFPFKLPRSYTSMVSSSNDLNGKMFEEFLDKIDLNRNLARSKTASYINNCNLVSSFGQKCTSYSFKDECLNQMKQIDDYNQQLIEEKSIRRQLSSRKSANEAVKRARAVQERVRVLLKQNERIFYREDRNIRYGKPFVPINISKIKLL